MMMMMMMMMIQLPVHGGFFTNNTRATVAMSNDS